MKGKHQVIIKNRRVSYALELNRNISVILGDSGTGKTTLINALQNYEELGPQSGVSVSSDKPCHVLHGSDWMTRQTISMGKNTSAGSSTSQNC